MINPEILIAILQNKGPSLPTHLKKDVGMDSLLISAMLSNLVSAKKVKLSQLKIGTSPLYYLPGQEDKLIGFISKLPEKEKRSVEKLQAAVVLRDKDLDPVTRYCLGMTKDYAEALTVTINNEKEVFWKWYMASDAETEQKIRELLDPGPLEDIPKPTEIALLPEPKVEPEPVVEPEEPEIEEPKVEAPKVEKKPKVEVPKIKKPSPVGKAVKALKEFMAPKGDFEPNPEWLGDDFYKQVSGFFQSEKISVENEECIRKRSEYDFELIINSPIGEVKFYCKAKSKKKLNEGDLSTFFLKAQSYKMPILLLTTGELTKKAQELLDNELPGLTVKKI